MIALLTLVAALGTTDGGMDKGAGEALALDAGPVPVETAEVTAAELAEINALLGAGADAGTQGAPPVATPIDPASSIGRALQSFNPDLSLILDGALAVFSKDGPLQTGGHDPTANGFNLQALELAVQAAVDPYFRFAANLVFSQFGVEIEEAYATTSDLPWRLQARGGQFLTRFGRQNPTHLHTWNFVDQPFALGRVFGGEGNRGLGVELSWLAPLDRYVEVLGSATSASGASTGRSFLGGSGLPVRGPLDVQYTGALKSFHEFSDDLSLLGGLSAATGPNATGASNYSTIYGLDLYLRYRPISEPQPTVVTWQTEVFYRRRQVPGDLLHDVSLYSEVLWRFDQRLALSGRYELGTPARGFGGRVVPDALDPEWEANRHRVSAALSFYPTEFSRLRLQGQTDLLGWEDSPRYAAFLTLEVAVGAHGAHAF